MNPPIRLKIAARPKVGLTVIVEFAVHS